MSEFSERLRFEIEQTGLYQKQFAAKVGISEKTLASYIRGQLSMPPAHTAVDIAAALGCSVEYLVTGKNSPDSPFASITPEIRQLIRSIESLPPTKQRIVIKNALNLADSLKNSKY